MKTLITAALIVLAFSFEIHAQQRGTPAEYSSLKQKLFEAKYCNNAEEHARILKELISKFPEHVTVSEDASEIIKAGNGNGNFPNTPDFGPGDINIFPKEAATGQSSTTDRFVDIESDSNGVQYVSFVSPTFDTLYIMKSSNGGMTWLPLTYSYFPLGLAIQSFDMFVTDSASTFRLGFVITYNSIFGGNIGNLIWLTMNAEGTGSRSVFIRQRDPNYGWKNCSLVSDGYDYTPGSTYWYTGYVRNDSATGAINMVQTSVSPDWGYTWIHDTVYSGVDIKNLSMNYNHYGTGNDTIYCGFEYTGGVPLNKSTAITRINLNNYGTSSTWTFSGLGTSADETEGEIAVNRKNNQMAFIYTQTNAGTGKDIRYKYFIPGGTYFIQGPDIEVLPGIQNRPRINCIGQEDKWRVVYCSAGTTFDTVIYRESVNITGGFGSRSAVNVTNLCEAKVFPAVTGFKTGSGSYAGGTAFVRNTDKTLWYDATNLSPTGVHEGNSRIKSFSLSQNYPNPFNPVTKIEYELPVNGNVSLGVYDMTGKEVMMPVNSVQQAGHYSVNINGSELSSGIYFYKLTVGDFVSVRKMSLVK